MAMKNQLREIKTENENYKKMKEDCDELKI